MVKPRLVTDNDIDNTDNDEPVSKWLMPHVIPMDHMTLIAAPGGMGKSTLASEMAVNVTTRKPWPDGHPCPKGKVLWFHTPEEDEKEIETRLIEAGADFGLVKTVNMFSEHGPIDHLGYQGRTLRQTIAALGNTRTNVTAHGNNYSNKVRLVVIDPIQSFFNVYSATVVARSMYAISSIAKEFQCAVIGITHMTKKGDKVIGHNSILTIARYGYRPQLYRRSKGRKFYVLRPLKYSKDENKGELCLEYEIVKPKGSSCLRAIISPERQYIVDHSEALHNRDLDEAKNVEKIIGFFERELKNGPLPVDVVKALVKGTSFTWREARKVANYVGLEEIPTPAGHLWKLPDD